MTILTNLQISGWRSFAPDHPAELAQLGSVNLLIGPNNVGKSNIGRFLVRLRDALIHFKGKDPWAEETEYVAALGIEFPSEEADSWLRQKLAVTAEIGISLAALNPPSEVPEIFLRDGGLRFRVKMSADGTKGSLEVTPLAIDGTEGLVRSGSSTKLLLADGTYTDQITSAHKHRHLAVACCKLLAESIIEIRPLRDPSRKSVHSATDSTDGGEILAEIQAVVNDKNKVHFWTQYQQDLESWFGILLGETSLRLEINDQNVTIQTIRGGVGFKCALPDLGAGVSEILTILAYLRLKPHRPFLVVLDEPEAHLHPAAVVELSRIMTQHLRLHQLLVTTHSTALVDAVEPSWQAFRVSRGQHDGTMFERLKTSKCERSLLADLGIRPSQLFLARVALWVEGPSDIPYWTALIREADSKLVAGRDFAFVTYGGASSAHLGFDEVDDDRLVEVLKLSNRAVIFCDRDRADGEEDRDLVKRLMAAAESLEGHGRVERTMGREIENSVLPETLKSVVQSCRQVRFNKPRRPITYVDYEIGVDDAFDEVVSQAARGENGETLDAADVEKIKNRLNGKKHEIAAKVLELSSTERVFRADAVKQAPDLVSWMLQYPTK